MECYRAWKFGNNINTDIISPPEFMEHPIDEAKLHAMEPVDPAFGRNCLPGDIFVAGENLGSGSSRETAPLALKALGIRYIVAKSFARIFYRNCVNIGLLPLECADVQRIATGDELSIDPAAGSIHNRTKNENYPCSKLPEHVLGIADCGGLLEYIVKHR